MTALTLVIGNKNYSSWSLRPWLVLKHFAIPFTERRVVLDRPETKTNILQVSPSGKVPALIDGTSTIWDSLAISEYLAERFPDRALWPRESKARAVARSVSAEMHSSFGAMRTAMPMNCRATDRRIEQSAEVKRDIARIVEIWQKCRGEFGGSGEWLFGDFCIADAMFAPVVFRFRTYGVSTESVAQTYRDRIINHPAVQEWFSEAQRETETSTSYEVGK